MNTKIIVCCHKKTDLPSDKNFLPVQAGRKISDVDLGIAGDDEGENISELNPYFCELTAQYWAWKNLKNIDVVGLCHYRRFFKLSGGLGRTYRQKSIIHNDIDTSLIPRIMKDYDIILPKPVITTKSLYDLFSWFMTEVQMQIYLRTFFKMHPEYEKITVDYLNGNKCIGCNMSIMPWTRFCQYNEFLFSILFKAKEYIKSLPYSYYNRSFGMFSEILLPMFCKMNGLKVKYLPVIVLCDQSVSVNPYKAMFPKFLTTFVNDGIRNLKYLVSNRRTNDTYITSFWEQYLIKDGIVIR